MVSRRFLHSDSLKSSTLTGFSTCHILCFYTRHRVILAAVKSCIICVCLCMHVWIHARVAGRVQEVITRNVILLAHVIHCLRNAHAFVSPFVTPMNFHFNNLQLNEFSTLLFLFLPPVLSLFKRESRIFIIIKIL